MKWADFATEKETLQKNLESIKLGSQNVKNPQGSSRDQVDLVGNKRLTIKRTQRALMEEIFARMDNPEELESVNLPWDMPAIPPTVKGVLMSHHEKSSNVGEMRETLKEEWHQRRDAMKCQWTILDS